MSDYTISGDVAAGFGPVADAFAANFDSQGEVGAAVSVIHEGRTVVDLWGGWADSDRARPWEHNTIVTVFSTTKGVTATCAALLIERGQLDPDASIADVTGWNGVVAAIAAQTPNWEPGTAHGYHARSYGWIVGELIRRITGRTPGRYFRDEIGDPHDLSFWIGLPPEQDSRVATLVPDPNAIDLGAVVDHDSLLYRVMAGPSDLFAHGYDETWNEEFLRRCEMPSSNGVGDARSLARLYALIIGAGDAPRLLSADTLAAATAVQSAGIDCVIGMELTFGLGYSPAAVACACGGSGFVRARRSRWFHGLCRPCGRSGVRVRNE